MSEKHKSENRLEKEKTVAEIKEKIQKAKSIVLVENTGITVKDDTALRSMFRKANVEYKILKNRLVKIAFNELGITDFDVHLEHPTGFAFSYDDITAPAKILKDNGAQFEKIVPKCGLIDGTFVNRAGLKEIADLPSKEVLIAKLMGALQSPVINLAYALNGTVSNLVYALSAVAKAK